MKATAKEGNIGWFVTIYFTKRLRTKPAMNITSDPMTLRKRYSRALGILPLNNISPSSAVNVEKVVKPPQKPIVINKR